VSWEGFLWHLVLKKYASPFFEKKRGGGGFSGRFPVHAAFFISLFLKKDHMGNRNVLRRIDKFHIQA
jgi:hypothetical protein